MERLCGAFEAFYKGWAGHGGPGGGKLLWCHTAPGAVTLGLTFMYAVAAVAPGAAVAAVATGVDEQASQYHAQAAGASKPSRAPQALHASQGSEALRAPRSSRVRGLDLVVSTVQAAALLILATRPLPMGDLARSLGLALKVPSLSP